MRWIWLGILLTLCAETIDAQPNSLRFVENKGQWPSQVLAKSELHAGSYYLEADRFTFNFLDSEQLFRRHQAHSGEPIEKPLEDHLNGHAYQVQFKGCDLGTFTKKSPSQDYFNYFIGDDPTRWASGARAFETLSLEKLYPNIDLKVYAKGAGVKYDFIIHPGGMVDDIQLEYLGIDRMVLKRGKLIVHTSVNKITESEPFAYQVIDGQIQQVSCHYQLTENTVSFAVSGDYNPELPLIIDPELRFSTYSGSTADNFGFTATFDAAGFLYSGSSIFGNGYPTTLGAYQGSWAGGTGAGTLMGTDIGITKYDTSGTSLVYSTYLGGSSDDLPHSLIVNDQGELYMYGTTSSADFPTTSNALDQSYGGGTAFSPFGIGVNYINGSDIVVSKLSADGTALQASTFIGGSSNDGLNTNSGLKFNYADEMRGEVLIDNNGDVIIVSSTFSSDFPVTTGAYQSSIGGGQDGCIVKLDPNLENLLYGTFLGGLQADAIYSVDIDSNNNIVVAGGTTSTNLPTTPGAISAGYNGGIDGYVSILSTDLSTLIASTYYGTNEYEQIYFVQLDSENNVYIFGQTRGTPGLLIQNVAYSVNNGGMLVAKFDPNLSSVEWSTRFGSGANVNPNLSPAAFLVDVCNKIYLCGWGGATNVAATPNAGYTTGLPITADAFQSTTDGSDFYLMVLEADASAITYATFFGGNLSNEHVDGGTSRFDRSGKVYQSLCAGCGNNDDFPIYPEDAWSPTNNSSNCNNGVFKFDFNLPIVIANFSATNVCLPDPVVVSNLSTNAETQNWFVDGQAAGSGTTPNFDFSQPGTYQIFLEVINSETCNATDTLSQAVTVYPEVSLEPIADVNLCEPEPIVLTANTNGTATSFHWSTNPNFTDQLNTPLDSAILVSPSSTTTYYIQVSNGPCTQQQAVTVTPAPLAALNLQNNTGCEGDTISVSLENLTPEIGFTSTTWFPEEDILSGQGTNQILVIAEGNQQINISITTDNGCLLVDSVILTSYPLQLELSSDTTLCNDSQSAVLTAFTGGNAESYIWSENSDFSDPLNNPNDSTIVVSPPETTTYYAQVTNGTCQRTAQVTVYVLEGSAELPPEHVICSGDTLQITAVNLIPTIELFYSWSPESDIISGSQTSTITVSPNETTVYFVEITTEDGCVFTQSTVVYVSGLSASLVAATANPNTIPAGQTSVLTAIPNNPLFSYAWSPTDGLESPFSASTLAQPEETTTYTVTIIDPSFDGGWCKLSASVVLKVYDFVCGPPNVYLPNAFTPNGDGNNDVLYLRGENITSMHLAIYNRWGELVFETRDQAVGWDGTYRDKDVDPAVFVYHLEVDCGDGQQYIDKGNVTVIR